MAFTVTKMTRVFQFNGIRLPDPNPEMSVDNVRLNGEDVESVRDAFDRLAACCETLACARRLMKIMPGNERSD